MMINMKSDIKDFIINCLFIGIALICFYMLCSSASKWSDANHQKYIETTKYEITVIDKYETIGSTFHVIGGRASEKEYHVIYTIKPLTENAKKNMYGDTEKDEEFEYKSYRKAEIGKKYITHYPRIHF